MGYYRFFNDFITVPVLFQTQSFGKVRGSVGAIIEPIDVLYFIDTLILLALVMKREKPAAGLSRRSLSTMFITGFLFFALTLLLRKLTARNY